MSNTGSKCYLLPFSLILCFGDFTKLLVNRKYAGLALFKEFSMVPRDLPGGKRIFITNMVSVAVFSTI